MGKQLHTDHVKWRVCDTVQKLPSQAEGDVRQKAYGCTVTYDEHTVRVS